jgi:hypothetical protein
MKNLLRVALIASVAFAAGCGDDKKDDDKQCTPETDQAFCARLDAVCGPLSGTDNCGAQREVADCGACGEGQSCNANKCEAQACTPESNAQFCARLGATCGAKTAKDNCGDDRTVNDCGSCSGDQVCVANKCEAGDAPGCNVPASYGDAEVVEGSEYADIDDFGDIYSEFSLNEDSDYLVVQLYNGFGAFPDVIKTGTYTLKGDDLDPWICGLCVSMEDETGAFFFATGGTVEISRIVDAFEARLTNVTFHEMVVDEETEDWIPAPDGCETRIDSLFLSSPLEKYEEE